MSRFSDLLYQVPYVKCDAFLKCVFEYLWSWHDIWARLFYFILVFGPVLAGRRREMAEISLRLYRYPHFQVFIAESRKMLLSCSQLGHPTCFDFAMLCLRKASLKRFPDRHMNEVAANVSCSFSVMFGYWNNNMLINWNKICCFIWLFSHLPFSQNKRTL